MRFSQLKEKDNTKDVLFSTKIKYCIVILRQSLELSNMEHCKIENTGSVCKYCHLILEWLQ